jgi:Mce-associated membrane protein
LNRTSLTNPTLVNTVLAVILAGLCVWLLLFAVLGSRVAPGQTPAQDRAEEYAEIQRAARAETLAFLTIDHTRMDELTARVLEGATGSFKKQYQSALKSLKESAANQESFSRSVSARSTPTPRPPSSRPAAKCGTRARMARRRTGSGGSS